MPSPDRSEPLDPGSSVPRLVRDLRRAKMREALFGEPPAERRIGRYRVLQLLGRGGMGTVLEAMDDDLERPIALKLLHRGVSAKDQQRLVREARALARLSHPNVVQVHEVGLNPRPFVAMELVRGQTLDRWGRDGRGWRQCVQTYLQAGAGLAAAHAEGLVHRDFKPGNCIIDDQGRVRVMDFGLALMHEVERANRETMAEIELGPRSASSSMHTEAMLGTVAYMAPEQLARAEVDERSDQFAYCVSLYEALYGERPFSGHTPAALLEAIDRAEIARAPRGSKVPAAVRRVVLRGLAYEPAKRWPSMNALLAALEARMRPRWRGPLAIAAVLASLGWVATAPWHDEPTGTECEDAQARLEGAWDEATRARVRDGLQGSPLPFAADAWAKVEPRLDDYARRWRESWTLACRADRAGGDQPELVSARRAGCLHQRRVALREVTEVLGSAEPATVERAVSLVSRLPSLEHCQDITALLAEIPPPSDPTVQAQVLELSDLLARARTLRIAGRYPASLEVVDRVEGRASDIDYTPLRAEIEQARGWALYGEGRLDEAVEALERAYALAVSVGHDAVATDAAGILSAVVGAALTEPERGLQWGIAARAHARRPSAPRGAEAFALANIAMVHQQRGALTQARDGFEQALAGLQEAFGPDDVQLAFTINGLALTLLSLGEVDEAIELHQRALALRRANLGPRHPHVAMSLNNLAIALHRTGRVVEAIDHFQQALEIKEEHFGSNSPEILSSLINVGNLRSRTGDYDAGRSILERAVSIAMPLRDTHGTQLGASLQSLGLVYADLDQPARAEATLLQALEIQQQAYGPSHPQLVATLVDLAGLSIRAGDYDRTATLVDRIEAIVEAMEPNDNALLGSVPLLRSRIALGRGDAERAVTLAEHAVELLDSGGAPAQEVGHARLTLLRAKAGRGPEAREQAIAEGVEQLDDLRREHDPAMTRLRSALESWLEDVRRPDPPR